MSDGDQPRRRTVLDGSVWLLVLAVTIAATMMITFFTPTAAMAQVAEPERLGDDLYPPTHYLVEPSQGIVDIGRYDIGCANDGFIGDVACVTVGTGTNIVFSVGKLLVAAAIWLLEAATGFVIEATLTDAATVVADLLDQRVLGPMQISHLGLVTSALYMGWQFLKGRIGRGAGEFAVTLAVYGALIAIATGPGFGGAVTGATTAAGHASTHIVALSADTGTDTTVTEQVGNALMASFVRDPYDTINWGHTLTGTACAAARNSILESGPHGFDDAARTTMEEAGCAAEASFNTDATVERLIGAALYLMVAVAALTLFVITAFTLVVAKGMALFLIALLPIALYAGLFPGGGRSLLWHWVSALTRVVALIIVMGVFLALLVTGLTGLLAVDGTLWNRFLLVVFFMAIMWVGRSQLVDMSNRFGDSTLRRLEGSRIGGSHGANWMRPYQQGGVTGLGVTRTLTDATSHTVSPATRNRTRAAAATVWKTATTKGPS